MKILKEAEKKNWFVVQKYFNDGRIKVDVIDSTRADVLGYQDGFINQSEKYDLYVDGFNTRQEADEFAADTLRA